MSASSPFSTDRLLAGTLLTGLHPIEIEKTRFELPYYLIKGEESGLRLVVTAGIHGGEYPCVEAAVRLGNTIDRSKLRGEVLIIPSANPMAFAARSIYITPCDGKNLNRRFPGKRDGTFTEQWAAWLFENVISTGDAYIDLHGGDMIEALVPFTACYAVQDPNVTRTSQKIARAFGIRHVLMHPERPEGGPTGMAVLTAAESGVPAVLAEAGGQGVWDEENVALLRDGVLNAMGALGMYDPGTGESAEEQVLLSGWSWLRSESAGLFYPSVVIGQDVQKGQPVGHVGDFFGRTQQEFTAPVDGIVLFLVTSLAMNEGDPVMAIAY